MQDFVSAADEARPQIEVRADDEFNIIYSSGTTGTPKGIVQDHALRAYAAQSLAPIGFPPGVRTLVNTSLYSNWTLGALIYTLWAGGSVRFSGKFSPPGLLAQCREFRPQNVYLVPVQISRLLDDAPADALRALPPALKWTAGSYLAPELKSALQRSWPGGVVEIYGMTEGAPFTLLEVHRHPDKVHTVGRSDPPEDLKIIDEQGCELPPGERGEIVGRVRHVMRGYKGDEPGTQALVWRDTRGIAYFRSGDIGMLDEEGFLQVVDRKKRHDHFGRVQCVRCGSRIGSRPSSAGGASCRLRNSESTLGRVAGCRRSAPPGARRRDSRGNPCLGERAARLAAAPR